MLVRGRREEGRIDAVAEENRAMMEDREAVGASFFPEVLTADQGEWSILEAVATSGTFFMKTFRLFGW